MKPCLSVCALLAATAAAFGLNLPASLERAGLERNEGQFDKRVRFVSRASGVDLYLQQDRVVFAANNSQLGRLEWKGAKRPGSVAGVHALPTRSNYYTGSDRSRWLDGVRSAPLSLPVIPAKPGLFSAKASGTGQGAVLNQDTSRNPMENPAEQGSIVVVFGTGSGMNDPPSVDGRITAAAGKPVLPFSATFGGMTAEVLYLGPAPGLVAGVFQANLRVPANVASGNAVSQTGLTVAVK